MDPLNGRRYGSATLSALRAVAGRRAERRAPRSPLSHSHDYR